MAQRTFTSEFLSGSTNGRPIKIVGTSSGAATTVHTAPANTTGTDHVTLFLTNTSGSMVSANVMWGGTTDPDDYLVKGLEIQANSPPIQIASGHPLNNGLIVKVFASTGNVILASGRIRRAAP